MIRLRTALLAILALVLTCQPAWAQKVKSFAVLPFTVNGPDKYAYLSQGVQDMLNSRLTWAGHLQPIDKSAVDQKAKAAPKSESDAKSLLGALKADYLVYGSMTIAGDDASLDIKVMDSAGKVTPKSAQTKLNSLIPTMESVAKDLNAEVFKRADTAARDPKTGQPTTQVNQMNPNFVVNQTAKDQQVYLNPNFRYAGNTETPGTWRSQSLPFAANGMAMGDLDGDGTNAVVLISDSEVHVYHYINRQLSEVAKWSGPPRVKFMRVSVVRMSLSDKKCKIAVSGYFDHAPSSTILSLEGNKLVAEAERIPYYLTAVKLPPRYQYQLVGSRGERKEIFTGGVFEMSFSGGKLSPGAKLSLPSRANPFNFAYLPEESGYKLVMLDNEDHLQVFSGTKNDVLAKTEEQYAGSSMGIEHDRLMAPMTTVNDSDYLWNYYYVPLPLLVATLGSDKKPELLVSRNISVASQFFENYRFFSQGEVHALQWDGVGMSLKWKTRRIKGTIVGYDVGDIDGDKTQDLVICINTFPGATGFKTRRTIVQSYALDLDSTKKGGQFGNVEEVGN